MITYSKIYEQVADWLNREDLNGSIPSFVRLAELQIYRFLRIRMNEYTQVLNWEDDPYNPIALPEGYKEMRLVTVNDTPLERISDQQYYEKLDGYKDTDQPQYFMELDDQLYILPWPQESQTEEEWGETTVTLNYYGTASSDLLSGAEDAYIYGGVMQAWLYLSGPEGPAGPSKKKADEFEEMFNKALMSLKGEHRRREYAGSTKEVQSAY